MQIESLEGRELMSVTLASYSTSYAISTTPTVGTTVSLNPQPLPPGGTVMLNPQPLPPRTFSFRLF
jgi:hypothetical protein